MSNLSLSFETLVLTMSREEKREIINNFWTGKALSRRHMECLFSPEDVEEFMSDPDHMLEISLMRILKTGTLQLDGDIATYVR